MDLFVLDTRGSNIEEDRLSEKSAVRNAGEIEESKSDNEDASTSEDESSSAEEDSPKKNILGDVYVGVQKDQSQFKQGSLSHLFRKSTQVRDDDVVSIKDEDDDCIVIPRGTDDEDDDEEPAVITKIPELPMRPESESEKKVKKKKKKKGEFTLDDAYINYTTNDYLSHLPSESLIAARKETIDKLLKEKSQAHQPGLEKLEFVPNKNISDRKLKKQRKIEREKTKGKSWFDLPATEVTEEVKRDLEVLQMRSVLDPKTFYKKNDLKVLPKYFQIGHVEDNAADFYHSRIPKKDRKRTLVDELLADAEFQQRSKQKFKEIVQEKQRTQSKEHRLAKRLKKRKK